MRERRNMVVMLVALAVIAGVLTWAVVGRGRDWTCARAVMNGNTGKTVAVPVSCDDSGQPRAVISAFPAALQRGAQQVKRWERREVTVDEIAALPDDKVLSRVYFRLLGRVKYDPLATGLSDIPRALVMTTAFEDEAFADGIDQYVENQGADAAEALEAVADGYRLMGATEMANVASDAIRALEARSQPAKDVARAYDVLYDRMQDTEALRVAFIRMHPSAFAR